MCDGNVLACSGAWLDQMHDTHPLHQLSPCKFNQMHGAHPLYLLCTYLFAGPRVLVLTALILRARGTKTGPWPGLFAFGTQSGQ